MSRSPGQMERMREAGRRAHEALLNGDRDWLTGREVAVLAGVSVSKVSQDLRTGILRGERAGGTLRIPKSVADSYAAAVARAAGELPLSRAAKLLGVDHRTLERGIGLGHMRVLERRLAGRTRTLFSELQLLEDVANLPACPAEGCTESVLLGGEHCAFHAHAVGLAVADRAHERLLAGARDWYTAVEAARLAGVSKSKVSQDIRSGLLRAQRVGRTDRITAVDARAYRRMPRARRTVGRPTRAELAEKRHRIVNLFELGRTEDEIARELGCARSNVCWHLDEASVERNRRRSTRQLPPAERAEQVRQAQALWAEGHSTAEIGGLLGISRTLAAQHVALGDPEAARSADPERLCAYCGNSFVAREPHIRNQRFCSKRCERDSARDALQDALAGKGLVGVAEAADRMGLRRGTVHSLIRGGALASVLVRVPGTRGARGIPEAEICRLEKQRARDGRYRKRWLDDVDRVVRWLEVVGSIGKTAQALRVSTHEAKRFEHARWQERAVRHAALRKGRPPRSEATRAKHHQRWLDRFTVISAEILHDHEVTKSLLGEKVAGPAPTDGDILRQLVLEDWELHAEDWARDSYPADTHDPGTLRSDFYGPAVDRVRKALKRLQMGETKNTPS